MDHAFYASTGKNLEEERHSPSEKNIPFAVPVLSIKQGNLFEEFEETHLLDHPWELAKCDALLTEEEYLAKDGQHGPSIKYSKDGIAEGQTTPSALPVNILTPAAPR